MNRNETILHQYIENILSRENRGAAVNKQQILEQLDNSQDLPMLSRELTEVFSLLSAPNALHLTDIAEKIAHIEHMQEMLTVNLSSSYFPFLPEKKTFRELLVFMGLIAKYKCSVYCPDYKTIAAQSPGKS